ncbi:Cappuccino [Caligus rogercresseyi]|uniref:Cappuccino n=1 Tax=Caligus rogercresseyi TaxID=217165 RepID=A0A7T8GPY9_CALRO|nr:Cappuccino [Caligus rogercresseyi]
MKSLRESEAFEGSSLLCVLESSLREEANMKARLSDEEIKGLSRSLVDFLITLGVLVGGSPGSFREEGTYSFRRKTSIKAWRKTSSSSGCSGGSSPQQESSSSPRLGLKYTEAEMQQAVLGLKRQMKESISALKKEHDEELFKLRGEQAAIESLEYYVEKITALESEIEELKLNGPGRRDYGSLGGIPSSMDRDSSDIEVKGEIIESSMKSLYWTRIQTTNPNDEESLWKELEEASIEVDEFDDLFSRPEAKPKTKKAANKKEDPSKEQSKKVSVAKILEAKRSQNLGIFIKSKHLDISEIENTIYNFDNSVIDFDTLVGIKSIQATEEELSAIAAHSQSSDVPLDIPEQFLLELSQISSFNDRWSALCFKPSLRTTSQTSRTV